MLESPLIVHILHSQDSYFKYISPQISLQFYSLPVDYKTKCTKQAYYILEYLQNPCLCSLVWWICQKKNPWPVTYHKRCLENQIFVFP